ncbi:hypothetical protein F9K33_07015 [bacterium]|nr:MAG: hypothetical protein F9K33_07015 [bacterium]
MPSSKKILIIAHRGVTYSGYPENSIPGFNAVLEEGYDGVELDVRLTKDKELVVFHDIRLERLTEGGRGMVRSKKLSDLQKIKLKSDTVETYIPSLSDVLELYKHTSVFINIEIKSEMPLRGKIEKRVVELIYKFGLQRKVIISSFNPLVIKKIQKVDPTLRTGFIYEKRMPRLNQRLAKGLIVDSWHPNYNGITDALLEKARESGCTVFPWTVNTETELLRMKKFNVDGVITDFPNLARQVLR